MANFCKLKDSLCNHVLTIPGPEDELVLYTNASDMASVVVSMS